VTEATEPGAAGVVEVSLGVDPDPVGEPESLDPVDEPESLLDAP
jgi:hypothetical protein